MKNILKTTLVLLFLAAISGQLQAQEYDTAVGLRGGWGFGLTGKKALGNDKAIEAIVDFRYRGLSVTGLYEIHKPLADIPNTMWYFGGGAHVGFYSYNRGNPWFNESRSSVTNIGLDGIIGVEYTSNEYPINISLDWKPVLNLTGFRGFGGNYAAVSLRYVID